MTPSAPERSGGWANPHLPANQPTGAHHRLVAELARDYTRHGKVLDVGCGLGHTLSELHRHSPGLTLVAADSDEATLQRCGQRVPNARLLRMRLSDDVDDRFIDFGTLGSDYETVILSHVLEHLSRPLETVRQLLTLLRPGGQLILVVPNPLSPAGIIAALLRRSHVNRGHLQAWDRAHWETFLERGVGCEIVRYASDEVRIFPLVVRRRLRFLDGLQVGLARLLPWFSYSNIAVIRPRSRSVLDPHAGHGDARRARKS